MKIIDAVELKHFDQDGDGTLSDDELLQRDRAGAQAVEQIREGKLDGKIKKEIVEDLFVAHLLQFNLDRQRERLLLNDDRTIFF